MTGWLRHQKHALAITLKRLLASPLATLFTTLAMGVAISLPSGLYLALGNLNHLAGGLPAHPEISLFLEASASESQKQALTARLKQPDIAQARYVSREQALASLSQAQALSDITAGLTENPLPDAWIVRPHAVSRAALTRLENELGKLPGVAETHLDSQWAERLQAVLAIGATSVWLLGGLFAFALIATSGNAIRAQVLARHDEIQVSSLIGATNRYIRRPFLYAGALQGLLGGVAAGGVLALAGGVLREPVAQLASLYGSTFHLHPPTVIETTLVLSLATLFGWLGAWLAVSRTLRQVESAG